MTHHLEVMKMEPRTRIVTAFVAAIVVTAGIVATVTLGGSPTSSAAAQPSATPIATPSATPSPTPPPEPNLDTIKALTVDYTSPGVNCVALVQAAGTKVVNDSYMYDVGVRKTVDNGDSAARQWSDAISTPLPGNTPAEKRQALQVAICLDPYLGSVWGNMFATLKVGNVSVLDHNSWLQPYVDAAQINDQAASFGAMFNPKGVDETQATEYVEQNTAWQKDAEAIDTLIGVFQPAGVKALTSAKNWHVLVADNGPVAGVLPEAGLNPTLPDKLPALVLDLTQKSACAPLSEIGANVGDMRPEVFPTPMCQPAPSVTPKVTPSKTPKKPSKSPSPKPSKTPSPTPSKSTPPPSHTPTPTPTCTPNGKTENCGKDDRTKPTVMPTVVVCVSPSFMDRDTQKCVAPSSNPSPSASSSDTGKGDSGPGATNTVAPPSTSSPGPAPSKTTSPPTPVPTPTF